MSTLQVSNVHLETSGNNRIQYSGSNSYVIVAGGTTLTTVNSSVLSVGGDINTSGNVVIDGEVSANLGIRFASNVITDYTVSTSAPSGGSDGDVWVVIPA
jgi:uncharacterized protein (DUF342 family)